MRLLSVWGVIMPLQSVGELEKVATMKSGVVLFYVVCAALLLPACQSAERPAAPTNTAVTVSSRPTAVALTPTASMAKTPTPAPVLLFARQDDLWRTDVYGRHEEPLTTGETLTWGMNSREDWLLNARSAPPQVAPNGRWLAFSLDGLELVLVDIQEQTQRPPIRPGAPLLAWSPDSRYLAYQGYTFYPQSLRHDDELYIYDVQTHETRRLTTYDKDVGAGIVSIVWSPDGAQIGYGCCFVSNNASGGFIGSVQQMALATGAITTTGTIRSSIGGGSQPLCWTRNGALTPDAAAEETVRCSYTPPLHGGSSPDGALIASSITVPSTGDEPDTSVLTIMDADSEAVVQSLPLAIRVTKLLWSPDGRFLLLDDNEPDSPIWRINVGETAVVEEVVPNGYLLEVVAAWQPSN